MNFFQQELRKIVGPRYPDATYIGRVCYVYNDGMGSKKSADVTPEEFMAYLNAAAPSDLMD